MSGQEYQVPDLASVLRTLASFTPPRPHSQAIPPPSQNLASIQPAATNGPGVTATVPSPKLIDPATIIDWSSGLRCVMKTVAARENIIHEIRRMIKVQHEHEEQWWDGRQALLQRQANRKESQKKLDEVLRAVGGAVSGNAENIEDFTEELDVFDRKVHRVQVQMVKEMSMKLKSFGVPFFGTRTDLVRAPGEAPGEGKKIDQAELVELQRRMIGILEDLCKD